jgi:hypothetical protein
MRIRNLGKNIYTSLKSQSLSLWLNKIWIKPNVKFFRIFIFGIAILIAVLHAWKYPTVNISNRLDSPWSIAQNLVNGKGYSACDNNYFPFCRTASGLTAMRGPVPVLMFAGAILISKSPLSGVAVEIILYLGTLFLIYTILKQFDDRMALLGSLLWAISLPVIRQMADDHGEISAAFFISLGILFYQKGLTSRRLCYWAVSGLSFGIGALCLPVVLAVSLGLGIAILFTKNVFVPDIFLQRFKAGIIFIALFFIVIAPWAIRNQYTLGRPVLGSTLIGYNLFRMNYIIQQPNFRPHYVGPVEASQAVANLIQNSKLTGSENEAQMDSFYFNNAIHIILGNPADYLKLSIYRFLPLWFDVGVKEAYGTVPKPIDLLMTFQQLMLLIAIILGISKRTSLAWPYSLAAALFCGAYMAVDSQLSYLVGIMPVLVILASFSLPSQKPDAVLYNRSSMLGSL